MATLAFNQTHPATANLETLFFLKAIPSNWTATAASVEIGPPSSRYKFDYVLSNGFSTTAAMVLSFTIAGPRADFHSPTPYVTYDYGTGNARLLIKGLAALHAGGAANAFKAAALLLAGNDTITSLGTTGRILLAYAGNDIIRTGSGRDRIDGGTGADQMYGGAGDDMYAVDNATDRVFEANVVGLDQIWASVSYVLQAGSHVEEIHTFDAGNINLTGNTLVNRLYGNNHANVLNGGVGADRMEGFAGNDTYYVDHPGDVIVEAPLGGMDTICTTINYALTQSVTVEVLRAVGTANIKLTGNFFDNTIVGNIGANIINGSVGGDRMSGGKGNDTYYVDQTNDVVHEIANEGSDTVNTIVSYALRAGLSIETMQALTNAPINLSGNEIANRLVGKDGRNTLAGGTGNDTLLGLGNNDILRGDGGNDTMTGGAGKDMFVFGGVLSATTNIDRITDFSVPDDTIQLDNAVMAGLGTTLGTLAPGKFWKSTTGLAHNANDRIIYETDTGKLFHDANGSAPGGAIQFAVLTTKPPITAADFFVI